MSKNRIRKQSICLLMALTLGVGLRGQEEGVVELSQFPVYAGAYGESMKASAIQVGDRMKREARVDLQTRGGPGYQSDISVRGGIFEGTGMMVGGLAIFDPQTGHYFAELPIDPDFLVGAQLLTGVNNSINGFNSTAGSIDWEWASLESGTRITGLLGTNNRYGGRILTGLGDADGVRGQIGLTHDQSDGSVRDGDFEMERISGRLEIPVGQGELRLFGGHVEKYYGWPGMYTGFASLSETEDYSVSLLGWQWESGDRNVGKHRQHHRIGGYWRQLEDDYEFNRYAPNHDFEHLTEVWSLQGNGLVSMDSVDLTYRWALVTDRIRRSTSLEGGPFTRRDYGKLAVLAERGWQAGSVDQVVYAGMGLDTSSEDETVGTPQAGVSWSGTAGGGFWKFYTEYSRSSQVPGYTVLNSPSSGLFGGNSELGRETAETVESGIQWQGDHLTAQLVFFERHDEDLVDWVYDASTPNARQASAMDLEVRGIEGWLRWEHRDTAIEIGYAGLEKEADYLGNTGDASFYALNYARHRVLAGIEQTFFQRIEVRVEAEYRQHPSNALRSGGDEALYLNLHAAWEGFPAENWQLFYSADNLTGESFEPLPGTPGRGREHRVSLSYSW